MVLVTLEPVPESVKLAYGGSDFSFGKNYIVPKVFDPRIIEYEAVAVARKACDEGLAGKPIDDWDAYRKTLVERMAASWEI